jgi:hypothetical protein
MTEVVALLGTFVLFCLAVFQVLLVLGFPLGKMAWGGGHATLPKNLRIASGFSVIMYAFFAAVLLDQAKVISVFDDVWAGPILWVLVAYFFVGILMNGISRSKLERIVMTPVAAILAASFLYVAMN